jgi:hypothetical protein
VGGGFRAQGHFGDGDVEFGMEKLKKILSAFSDLPGKYNFTPGFKVGFEQFQEGFQM